MKQGRASKTAAHNVLFRTLEQRQPARRRLFDDPYAPRLLSWPYSLAGSLAAVPGGGWCIRSLLDHRWPGVRTSVAARTRLIDDTMTGLGPDQLQQLVILGAGFDTRPYRLERLRHLPVFEVDHPDTQEAKRAGLTRVLGSIPANVRFIATDFNLRQLEQDMAASGYQSDLATVFLWEGVTNYLTEDAVDSTLRWCAAAGPTSTLLFTYIHSDVLHHPERFKGADRLQASLHKVEEQLTFGMDPEAMSDYLHQRGFTCIWDLGAADYRSRYFGGRAQRMVGHEFYRAALARRSQPPVPRASGQAGVALPDLQEVAEG